jgi:putative ABC transport system permease protein
MSLLKEKWKELFPRRSFDYFFLDDFFASQYRAEEKLGYSVLCFSLLAIFIGCLGLFGLASFTSEQRTKEVGIRKVLGASVSSIVRHLSKEFMLLVVIANIIAWPIAYFAMNRWLENFAYRIEIGWPVFVLSGAVALVISILTVSYQAIKAAVANPVEALRYE